MVRSIYKTLQESVDVEIPIMANLINLRLLGINPDTKATPEP